MTRRIHPLLLLLPLALAWLFASSTATAEPDQAAAPNIPAPPPNSSSSQQEAPSSVQDELPLPYARWRGTGVSPPRPPLETRADAPLPLVRPRQLPRRPVELSAALSAFLPSCGSGSIDDRRCMTVSAGSGAELALLYRVGPFFALGGEAVLSGFGGRGGGSFSTAGGAARFFGVMGRVYFADEGAWDPYLALTLGAGSLRLSGDGTGGDGTGGDGTGGDGTSDDGESTTGFGARVAGGIDYLLGSHVRLGPAASFAHWLAWSESRCAGEICRSEPAVYGRLLGFATLGLRLTASFGEVL